MSIVSNTRPSFMSDRPANREPQAERIEAEFWVNIGKVREITDADGQIQRVFASFGGIPVDKINPQTTRSQDILNIKKVALGNNMLNKVMDKCHTLSPGEAVVYETDGPFDFEIRRVKGKEQPDIKVIVNDETAFDVEL